MPNPVVHFEIGCRDRGKAAEFYGKLFDWDIQDHGMASMISTKSTEGIAGHMTALGHEPHHYVTFYIQVEDIDAYLAKAQQLGARTVIPKNPVPGMGWFAWFADPDGNTIGLWTPDATAAPAAPPSPSTSQ